MTSRRLGNCWGSSRAVRVVALLSFVSALGCSDRTTIVSPQEYSERSDSSFVAADSSVLEINNFAGNVTVTPGNPGVVHVVAEKWAGRRADLDEIAVEMIELQNGVRVATTNPSGLTGVSVDVEATTPADARPSIQTAAGSIVYEGQAEGECSFATAAGKITLKLPADVNVEIYLTAGAGTIRVDFPVVGQVGEKLVDGTIGTGADGRIVAHVGSGEIVVVSQ
jgi:hypothetical protein